METIRFSRQKAAFCLVLNVFVRVVGVLVLTIAFSSGHALGASMLMSSDGQSSLNNSKAISLGNIVTTRTLSAIVSSPVSDLNTFDVVWVNPDLDYTSLRTGCAAGGALTEYVTGGGTLVICVAGNAGNQNDIAPGDVDYDRTYTHESETIAAPSHPYITGAGYGGAVLTTSDFQSWGSTDHGQLVNLVPGTTVILNNSNGPSFVEYAWGKGMVILSTLTYGWGGGGGRLAPQDNLIKYSGFTTAVLDDLSVTPYSSLISSGTDGGPFAPQCQTYTLHNTGPNSLDWTASATQSWVDVTPQSGSLASGDSIDVNVCLNQSTVNLPIGISTDTVTFTNVTSGVTQKRFVNLTVLSPQVKLLASDGASGDYFGYAVAMDGDYAISGAYYDDDKGTDSGSAYIFHRSGVNWVEQAKLTASDGYSSDNFGYSVAISGDYAIVGSPYDDDMGSSSGSAYIFYNNGASWVQQAKLTALDGYSSDYFGYSVAISGDYAIVGAYLDDDMGSSSGSAYIFNRNGSTWSQQAKLIASDGYSSDYFGYSVAIDGNHAVVGAMYDDDKGTDSGSAYVFTRNGSAWSQQTKLTALDGQAYDYFGNAVSLQSNCAVVGANGDDDKGSSAGAAYVFRNTSDVWNQEAKLLASDGGASDYFGRSVGIYGNRVIAGAYMDDDTGTDAGAAYLYSWNGSAWVEQLKLTPSDGAASDYFGWSVAIGRQLSIVGAYYEDDKGANAGAAYVFGRADSLTVSALNPPEDFNSLGFFGGPFVPASKDYVLSNVGPNSLDWTVEVNSTWIETTPANGTLAVGTNVTVTVQLTAEANGLVPGTYMDQIVFNNLTSGFNQSRQATLRVKRIPGEIELTDSIEPADDHNMPFGSVIIGVPVTGHITISNTDASHSLMITNISAAGASFEDFNDDFPTTTLNPANWTIGTGVPTVESLGLNPPSPPYSLTLNGDPSGEESVISRVVDLSGLSNVQLKYSYESGGNSEPPDGVNDLVFEYWDGTAWRELKRHFGTDPDTTTFTQVTVTLPAGALHAGFKLRIRALSDSGPNDYWFIDNISIAAAGSVGIGSGQTALENTGDGASPLLPGFRLENLPTLPFEIPPLTDLTFDVICDPCEVKDYEAKIVVESEDADEPQIEVGLTGRGILDYLSVTPDADQGFSGHLGGPFVPSYRYYYLSNDGQEQMNWTATADVNWLTLTPAAGGTSPGMTDTVTVSVNSLAESLPVGDYNSIITFTNTITGKIHLRTVGLNIYYDPKISVQPESLHVVVWQDETATENIRISNGGSGELNFAMSSKQTGFVSQEELQKGTGEVNNANAAGDIEALDAAAFAPGRILVRFNAEDENEPANMRAARRQTLLDSLGGGRVKKHFKSVPGLCVVELPDGKDMKTAIRSFRSAKDIIYAEPDYEVHALETGQTIPNDSSFGMQWNMHNTGQSGGTVDADIDAPEAWDISPAATVVIAVIDTGVQYNHPDIAANAWVNLAEKNGTAGVDDDGNGYIDDIYGYDFCSNGKTRDSDPMDDHGHGTHCAGVIGAVRNNGLGVAGVCSSAKIMAIKFLNSGGSGITSDAIDCIEYAVQMGANVMSNSWGGGSYSAALEDAIEAANQAGSLFVAAAGNNSSDTDAYPNYPSGYPSQNVIAVLATNYRDIMSSYSNYGLTTVDLGAQGGDSSLPVYSCYIGGSYTNMSGTSMACPHVAGACGLILSMCPSMPHLEVKNLVMNSVDKLSGLSSRCVSGGRLNLQKAVSQAQEFCSAQWIEFAPASDKVDAHSSMDVNVIFNGEREAGMYHGYIKVTSNDSFEPEIMVPVTLEVRGANEYAEMFDPCQPIDPCDPNCNDLAYHTIMFFPESSGSFYRAGIKDASAFRIDPSSGTPLTLGDDDYAEVYLGGKTVSFYGRQYDRLYIGSNGYITFETGDIGRAESFEEHFALPRISALFDDLDPSAGGTISVNQLEDRIVITFENVPEFGQSNANSFQIELLYCGKIALTLLNISTQGGLVGLSKGTGQPKYFHESDFTTYTDCGLEADLNGDMEVDVADFAIFANSWHCNYDAGASETATDAFSQISYGNNDGTVNFSGNWIESGESDGPTEGLLQIVDNPYYSMRIGSNSPNNYPITSLTREVDLTGATSAALSYYYTISNPAYTGLVTVEVSQNGTDWTTIATYNASSGYGFADIDISNFISPTTSVRFRTSTKIRMYLYIEYLEVRYEIQTDYYHCDFNRDFNIDIGDLITFCEQWLQ